MGPVEGDPVNSPPGSGPAAGGCAFGRLRSRASQAKRPYPWGLGRGLLVCAVLRTRQDRGWASCPTRPRHASGPCRSHPLNRTHPAFDSFPRSVGTALCSGGCRPLVGTGSDPVAAQRALTPDPFRYLTDVPTNGRHPPKAAVAHSRVNLSKAGYCGFAGCEPHGCGDQAPMDGFTASPQTHSAPPSHGMPLRLLIFRLPASGRHYQQVQGCKPCRTPHYGRVERMPRCSLANPRI